ERPKRPWAGIRRRRGTKPPRGLQRPQLSEWALAGAVALTGVGVSLLVWGGPPLVVASLFATLGVVYLAHGSPPKPGRPRSAHVVGASFLAALVAIGALGHRLQEPPAPPGLTSSKTPGPARAALPSFGARDLDLGAEVLQSRIEQAQTTCDAFDADGFQDRLRLRVARHHLGLLEEILTRRRAAEEEAYLARAATTSSEHATGTALRRLEKRQDAMTSWQRALALDPLHPQAVDWLCSVAIGSHVLRAQVAALEGIPDEIKAHYAAGRLAEGDLLWIHLQHVVPLASGLDAALATRPRPLPDAFARAGQSAYQRALARGDVPGARSVLGRQIEFPTPGGPPPWWEGLPGPELEISLLLLGSRTLFPPRATPTALAARRVNARAEALNWTRRTLRGRLRKALWHVEVSQLAQPYADCVAPADRIALRELVTGVRTLAGDSIQHAGLPEHFRIVHSKLHDARQRELRERLAWSGLSEQPDLELAGILPAARKRVRAQRAVAWREIELRWAIEGASPEEQP
ncbi:MAG: hypothetical protein JKY65_11605, partial [Planctomycetes bacterium]|nr:hypothetical protein [Planctomycetota bacterium]